MGSTVLCPALGTNGIYFGIHFINIFTFLVPFTYRAVDTLKQEDAHDETGEDLDAGEEGVQLDPDRSESERLVKFRSSRF